MPLATFLGGGGGAGVGESPMREQTKKQMPSDTTSQSSSGTTPFEWALPPQKSDNSAKQRAYKDRHLIQNTLRQPRPLTSSVPQNGRQNLLALDPSPPPPGGTVDGHCRGPPSLQTYRENPLPSLGPPRWGRGGPNSVKRHYHGPEEGNGRF